MKYSNCKKNFYFSLQIKCNDTNAISKSSFYYRHRLHCSRIPNYNLRLFAYLTSGNFFFIRMQSKTKLKLESLVYYREATAIHNLIPYNVVVMLQKKTLMMFLLIIDDSNASNKINNFICFIVIQIRTHLMSTISIHPF